LSLCMYIDRYHFTTWNTIQLLTTVSYVVLLCVFTSEFRFVVFGSSLPPVVCRGAHVYVICVCFRLVVSNTYCVLFVFVFCTHTVFSLFAYVFCTHTVFPMFVFVLTKHNMCWTPLCGNKHK
jgi:hypothetical protein